MKTSADILEIFLQPGEFYFSDAKTRIRTLLGSCVSITMWHPLHHVGGMCHYMLPERSKKEAGVALDGRYGAEAMQLFMQELRRYKLQPSEFQVKLFGGGRMFDELRRTKKLKGHMDIGDRNIVFARELLARNGFTLHVEDMGGSGHRNIILDLWSGDVWVRQVKKANAAA